MGIVGDESVSGLPDKRAAINHHPMYPKGGYKSWQREKLQKLEKQLAEKLQEKLLEKLLDVNLEKLLRSKLKNLLLSSCASGT